MASVAREFPNVATIGASTTTVKPTASGRGAGPSVCFKAMGRFRSLGIRARAGFWIGVAVYLLALAANPLLHHDLEGHVKAPRPCDACVASPPGLCASVGAPLDATPLLDAGRVEDEWATAPEPSFAVDAPGRSPPA